MTIQVDLEELKAQLEELVARVEAGEEVVIVREGSPVVALRAVPSPVQSNEPRRLGFLAHLGPVKILDADWDQPDPADEPKT